MNNTQTKRERRAADLLAHYEKCAKLAAVVGDCESPNGAKISVKLLRLEQIAHAGATAYCNGESYEPYMYARGQVFDFRSSEAWEPFTEFIEKHLVEILGGIPPGFFVNGDARGYALKIDNENPEGKALIEALRLHTDWGGYGILSPEIDGN